jgi:GAF domain-containing protein
VTGPSELDLPQRTRAALDELALLVLDRESTQTVLQKVVGLVARVMPAGSDVSITVVRNERPTTAAYAGARARDLDETQYERGHGPCVDAAIGGHVIEIGDGRTESRWPEYMPAFLAAGVLSSLGVPVPSAQLSAGLNVHAPSAGAFTDEDRRAVARFADFAAVALTNIDALEDAREQAENLRAAMEFRSVIEQAKGILMERHKVTANEAFRLLADASQHANRKLRELAEALVLTGELDD